MGLDVAAQAEWTGTWREAETRLARALAGWSRSAGASEAGWLSDGGEPVAWIELGPADPLVVTLRDRRLSVEARTTPWGPGYHRQTVAVLDALGAALPGGWTQVDDDTGFFATRQVQELERAFLRWAERLWSLDASGQSGLDGASVCLGLGEGPVEVPAGQVATPFGFRSLEWVARTRDAVARALAQGDPDPAARSAFLWWCPEPDALDWIQLGSAVCASEVIWRPLGPAALAAGGAQDPADEARQRAVSCFERALALDPTAPVPSPELSRLYGLLGRQGEAEAWAARAADRAFQGGYREGWIRWPVGERWSVEVPGWLRASVDADDGHDVFWDDALTVHLSVLPPAASGFSGAEEALAHLGRLGAEERQRARVLRFSGDEVDGYALQLDYGPESPELISLVQGQAGSPALGDGAAGRVSFTCVLRQGAAVEAALRLAHSLRPIPGGVHLVP